jgi:hypothetical protein
MARDLGLSKTYVSEALRTVRKLLEGDEKVARVEMTASMLSILEPLAAHARSWVLPGNESWFYFSYD